MSLITMGDIAPGPGWKWYDQHPIFKEQCLRDEFTNLFNPKQLIEVNNGIGTYRTNRAGPSPHHHLDAKQLGIQGLILQPMNYKNNAELSIENQWQSTKRILLAMPSDSEEPLFHSDYLIHVLREEAKDHNFIVDVETTGLGLLNQISENRYDLLYASDHGDDYGTILTGLGVDKDQLLDVLMTCPGIGHVHISSCYSADSYLRYYHEEIDSKGEITEEEDWVDESFARAVISETNVHTLTLASGGIPDSADAFAYSNNLIQRLLGTDYLPRLCFRDALTEAIRVTNLLTPLKGPHFWNAHLHFVNYGDPGFIIM